jgi:hypothetical protein
LGFIGQLLTKTASRARIDSGFWRFAEDLEEALHDAFLASLMDNVG